MPYQITYQVIQQPKCNTYDFIFETYDDKKLQRNAKANQTIVRLLNVPFPPELTEEDLIGPRNDKCDKKKVPNGFFIYRKWYTMCLNEKGQKNDQTSISSYISEHWRNEPREVRNYYIVLSKRAGELFKERYGKEGIKNQTPKKIQKNNKKNTKKDNKTTKQKNPSSTGQNMFEHSETSNFTYSSLKSSDFTFLFSESQTSHSSEYNGGQENEGSTEFNNLDLLVAYPIEGEGNAKLTHGVLGKLLLQISMKVAYPIEGEGNAKLTHGVLGKLLLQISMKSSSWESGIGENSEPMHKYNHEITNFIEELYGAGYHHFWIENNKGRSEMLDYIKKQTNSSEVVNESTNADTIRKEVALEEHPYFNQKEVTLEESTYSASNVDQFSKNVQLDLGPGIGHVNQAL
ncbi:hypothetical protein Glove_606g41 [Diversispora epigaea]|uniref:HMG box domain-containing protein n=1 Tax=Diversispora epigaea TaxID=1348612 RepID=A0A397G768_9GLOM|nr:hypothetical protein Glove_606g41 [Diversispora epigaea]